MTVFKLAFEQIGMLVSPEKSEGPTQIIVFGAYNRHQSYSHQSTKRQDAGHYICTDQYD